MFLQGLTTTLCVLCTSALAPRSSAPVSEASLLALVPDNSFALMRCEDFAGLRSRVERNDWYRLLSSESGAPLLVDLANEFHSQTDTDFDELLALGKQLAGEGVFFQTRAVSGFVTDAPADRAALLEAMRAWLPDPGPVEVARTVEVGDARVEVVAWPDTQAYGWRQREGHFAALVDHPRVLGLFSGDDAEALMATLEASLAGYGTDRRAPLVQGFEAARAGKPACHGIEAFIDFSPFVAEAERELASTMEGVLPDPTGMLGIDSGLWLLSANDVYPGSRIDCDAWLNIPRDTLAASLADTWKPIPTDLATQLPRDLSSLWAWNWDLSLFYARVRAAFVERHGEDSLKPVDDAIGAAKALSGSDPIVDVIDQLQGTFAVFDMRIDGRDQDMFDDNGLGILARLVDGEAFLSAFESLIDVGPLETELDLLTIEDVDVYVSGEDDSDFGAAFMPRTLLVGMLETLPRSLRAATGVADTNLLDGSEFHAAFDQSQGSCCLTIQRMASLEAHALKRSGERFSLPPTDGEEVGRNPFDALLVFSAKRTAEGFRFELGTD